MAGDGKVNGAGTTASRDPNFYAGHSRFELELEFIQSLSNPTYLRHLAASKYFEDEDFVRYLDYLQYFRQPEYVKYLQYPGPTLRALDLLQEDSFRKAILQDDVLVAMQQEGWEAAFNRRVGY